jgi:hypothetical protein
MLRTLALAPLLALAAYAPCHAPYSTPAAAAFETPCYDSVHTLSGGSVEVRRYPSAAPLHARKVQLIHVNLTGAVSSFDEAVSNGAEFLFCYFFGACSISHANVYASRTVPLLVRPPQRARGGDPAWAVDMAMAPSQWPGPVPAGENGINVVPLDTLVAARHCTAAGQPVEADFANCLTTLQAEAPALQRAGFAIDAAGAWTPTYAFYSLQNQTAPPFDIEVWVSVLRA